MGPYKNTDDLKNAIIQLEEQRYNQEIVLKKQFSGIYENLKPINVIKKTLKEIVSSTEIKSDLSNVAIGAITGYITRKIVAGRTDNPIAKMSAGILETFVTQKITENADRIKSFGSKLLDKWIKN